MTLILPYPHPLIILKNLAGCAVPQYETDINGLGEFPRIHQTVLTLFCSVDLGITKLITLSEKCLPSQQSLSQLGIKHEIHGCVEFEGIPVAKIVKIIESIENEIAADGKVAVHCRAGNGRTGTVLAAFIMKEKNLSSEEVSIFQIDRSNYEIIFHFPGYCIREEIKKVVGRNQWPGELSGAVWSISILITG